MPRRGEAVYHRKDGLWEARYVKHIDINGKKKYGSVYAHTYREAKAKRQDALDHILLYQGTPSARRVTVRELTLEWLMLNQNRLKVSSYQRYQGFYKNHIDKQLGDMRPIYLTTIAIHQFAMDRLASGLSPQSVNSVLTLLHSVLKYGHRQYQIPMPDIIYLTTEKKEMRVLSQEEQKKLVTYLLAELDPCKLGVLVALYTGLRIGELCALKWSDISGNSIHVRRTMQRLKKDGGGTELHIGPPKTKTSRRTIPVPSFLWELIESTQRGLPESEFFLAGAPGEIIEPRTMQNKFKSYLQEAGVEKANFHALRHTFATRCVECGFEVKSLSEILGHSNVQTTLNKYVHSSFSLKQSNMELLTLNL